MEVGSRKQLSEVHALAESNKLICDEDDDSLVTWADPTKGIETVPTRKASSAFICCVLRSLCFVVSLLQEKLTFQNLHNFIFKTERRSIFSYHRHPYSTSINFAQNHSHGTFHIEPSVFKIFQCSPTEFTMWSTFKQSAPFSLLSPSPSQTLK